MKKGEVQIYLANMLIGAVILATDASNADKVGFLGSILCGCNIAAYLASLSVTTIKTTSNDASSKQIEKWRLARFFDSSMKKVSVISAVTAVCYLVLTELLIKQWQVKVLSSVLLIVINLDALIEFCLTARRNE